jgi:hypothetical protein
MPMRAARANILGCRARRMIAQGEIHLKLIVLSPVRMS